MNSTDGFNGMLITLKKRISCISQDDTRDYQYMMFGHYDGMDIHCTREWYQLRPKGVCERAGNIIIGDTFQDKYTLKLYMPEPEVRECLEKQGFAYNIWEQMGYRDSNDSCVELLKRYPFISVSVINLSKQFVAGREKLLDKITASIKDAADKRAIPVEEVHCAVMPSIGYADFTLLFLRCLAKLLKKQKKGSVITYNYDDLLEFCLDKVANASSHEVQVICDCDERKTDNSQRINIHHPHGALSIKRNRFSKESEHIILTEHSYYQMEQKAYSWQNSVQAKALMDTSCAFIGFSGDDYNFRRIIKNVDCACKPRHYIFFCLNDLFHELYQEEVDKRYEEELLMSAAGGDSEVKKDEIRRELLEDKNFVYENIQLIDRLFAQYHYWRRHGIIPIWTTFDELPELIHGFYG